MATGPDCEVKAVTQPIADSEPTPSGTPMGWSLAAICLIGAAVSVGLGVAARVHPPTGSALFTLGFPTLVEMKVWLATAALALGVVQLVSALWMYGRIGGGSGGGRPAAILHRTSGVAAVLVSLPVAFQCLWVLGFGTYDTRVLVHSVAGCVLYGAFVTKMLALRTPRLPGWTLPVLGGLVLASLVAAWFTSALWWFTL